MTRFVRDCASGPGQRAACVCTIERLQRTLPYREFMAADEAIRNAGRVPPRARRIVDLAAAGCRDAR